MPLKVIWKYRSSLILLFTPITFLPVMIFTSPDLYTAFACAYTILVMAVYWVTEVLPLAVTALLPLVFYPFLGILPANTVSMQYLKDVNILFLGGLTVAVAVEHWNLHKRIALKVLTFVGAKPKWLLFGFMITTAFLSMWISNVATTAMMTPIAQAVLDELYKEQLIEDGEKNNLGFMDNLSSGENGGTKTKDNLFAMELGNIGDVRDFAKNVDGLKVKKQNEEELLNEEAETYYSYQQKYAAVSTEKPTSYFQEEIPEIEIKITKPDTPTPHFSPRLEHTFEHLNVKRNSASSSADPINSRERLISDAPQLMTFDERISRLQMKKKMSKALTICVCYASNIGGTATLTGTGPNLILAGQFKTTYPLAPEIDFGSWAFFSFPGMSLFLLFTWVWLQYLFLGAKWRDFVPSFRKDSRKTSDEIHAESIIKKQYDALGPMSFAEKSVLFLFIVLATLWLTRDPGFISGWGSLPIFKKRYVTDATIAMLVTFILFIWPSEKPNFLKRGWSPSSGPVAPLLTWKIVQQKMAWNVILLLGGGFAMALGAKESGLSRWIGLQLTPLNALSPFAANLICALVICALTQCTSNTATATVFIPILAELAEVLGVNPLYLMLPSTVITSYAFMLPVSTPPNAIVYSYGHLKMVDMIKAGLLLNVVGIFAALGSVHIFGGLAFHVFDRCPSWLVTDICNTTASTTSATANTISNSTLLFAL